ncbi:MAG: TraR/DksA C4-type zinc finger protein [Candidatus Pacebacteria bacterium]|jgi:DnaK suppressor protein|nr:TraR/DksA C4-type zinc finger protein [Candidatus Paceibacterota bacterium]
MLTPEQIKSYKQELKDEKEKILKELSSFGIPKSSDPNDFDSFMPSSKLSDEDNALEVSEYLNKLSTESLLENRLKEINQALKKTKTFGICEKCNKPIETKKLDVNPASDFCINCGKNIN